ncbi:YjeF N-terminal domain-containing protein [Calycina marina]|uniref:Enhancer of mRNA-decapping protein 3 n=1 Tax=Calycina marina TaxID=1763456 RepID=A0A9P7Z5C0_9HELO|nr:YjeF N-terminal domain-containing protein [Calycina marina]
MSNQFIGLTMLVTLSAPYGAQLRGVVSSIEPGKSLTLRDVISPFNGNYVKEFTINAAEIAELVEAPRENVNPKPIPTPVPIKSRTPFEDPAILSVGKRSQPSSQPPQIDKSNQWKPASLNRAYSSRTVTSRDDRALQDITLTISLADSLKDVHIAEVGEDDIPDNIVLSELEAEAEIIQPPQLDIMPMVKKPRRKKAQNTVNILDAGPATVGKQGIRPQSRQHNRKEQDSLLLTPASSKGKKNQQSTGRAKGWRQTPLLEPNPSFQPFETLLKPRRGGNARKLYVEESGWGTEEATDVQDMGDFDFTGNLAKFDKKTVFTGLEASSAIADEDRLVAHNRISRAKPGTNSGKNLHYTENVLDSPNAIPKMNPEDWNSEADSGLDDRIHIREGGSGRTSRRAESKLPAKRHPTSRKGSSTNGAQVAPPPRSLSIPATAPKPSFFLVPSNQRCEPISALQMLNLENIAENDLGLSEDMMAENAARGIAEIALSAVNGRGRGLTQGKGGVIPTIVVFAGNNKSGLRAIAAARHLRNHSVNVVVCVLGLERETEFLAGLKRQLKVYRSFGGKVLNKAGLLEYVKTLNAPIELVIDGLLGLTISFEELRTGDQATAYELIEFANRSQIAVLAIDIPTGIDPSTGKVNIIDGRQLYMHAKYIVVMGAPKKGLLGAMSFSEGIAENDGADSGIDWQLFVADIGLGAAVWKKSGTRLRRGVEFDGDWVLGMRYQGNSE